MKALLKSRLKNDRGFTLVELLAVIVILGIIAAIAVPSIGNVIENSRKDAHLANAQTLIESARLMDVSEDLETTQTGTISLQDLIDEGYVDEINAPGDADYDTDSTRVNLTNTNVILADDDSSPHYFNGNPNEASRDAVKLAP